MQTLTTAWFTERRQNLTLIFLAGMLAIHLGCWWVIRWRLEAGYQDFTIFYTAGKILSRGEAPRLYDNGLQYRTQQEFSSYSLIRKGPLPYNHIPVEAAIFVPFTKLPYFQAYLLWDALGVLALALAMAVLRPNLSAFRSQSLWRGVLLGLAFFPVLMVLVQGQDTLFVLLLFALTYAALRKDSDFVAGCWLGLALVRFTLVLPFVLILVFRRSWRFLAGFTFVGALMGLASAALVGWQSLLSYPVYVLRVERRWVGPTTSPYMPNLRGLIESAFCGANSYWACTTASIVVSAAVLWFCYSRCDFHSSPRSFDLSFSLALVASVLSSYHAYLHDLTVLLIAALLVANDFCERKSAAWGLAAPVFLLFLTPLYAVLLFKMRLAYLMAIPLLVWFWALARETSANRAGRLAESNS
ncbi:MAG TPA: glycosyltransferase family 87 protein [Terriglobales bacterium]